MSKNMIETTKNLQTIIDDVFEKRQQIKPSEIDSSTKDAIIETINLLDSGKLRIAEKINDQWTVHQWIKKAILLYFRIADNIPIEGSFTQFFDKVPLKYSDMNREQLQQTGVRIVPPATVR